ncbi:hypothetical protein ERJ75_001175700 [Trypanosoma vivax]|nr:hypothetical protein ERJ75_001175700 [Trypanosoma vivax]
MQHRRQRHVGVNEVLRLLACTFGRAALDERRRLLRISGTVKRDPGPQIRGAQWNSVALSRAKRLALERKLHEECFCLASCRSRACRRRSAPRLK